MSYTTIHVSEQTERKKLEMEYNIRGRRSTGKRRTRGMNVEDYGNPLPPTPLSPTFYIIER